MNILRRAAILAYAVCLLLPLRIASAESTSRVLWMKADGPVSAIMSQYIERGIATADREGYSCIVLELNTPGGQIDLMERIVTAIRESEVPVAVYVAPRGAMAGSAGTVITLAGHVAAMAPETAIGAASPVGSQGEDLSETLQAKEKEMLRALVRSLTANRPDKAVALAESTIEDARAVSAEEAKTAGLIDIVADSQEDLLRQLDGRSVIVSGRTVVLHTANAAITEFSASLVEILLEVLTNPNIVFLLLAIGAQAILIELSNPGGWIPGFVGVVCLALAFFGMGFLTINWLGLAFIGLAMVLFYLDLQAPTHGLLTVAGGGTFIAGALILFNSQSTPEFQRVSVPLVVGSGFVMAGMFFAAMVLILRARRRPVEIGTETLVKKIGVVRQKLDPKGMVYAAGELWSAETEDGSSIDADQPVEVVRVEGVRLIVRKSA